MSTLQTTETLAEREILLRDWYNRVRLAQRNHYASSSQFRNWHNLISVPVIVFSAIVGTTSFVSLSQEYSPLGWKILVAVLSAATAILVSLQTFLKFDERAGRHFEAATKLSSLKKDIEEKLGLLDFGSRDAEEFMRTVRMKWEGVTSSAPMISARIFRKQLTADGDS